MISNWFRTLPRKNKTKTSLFQKEEDLTPFIKFLWNLIDSPKPEDIKTKIEAFYDFSLENKIKSLPELYLLIEDHLIEHDLTRKYTKQKLRDNIKKDYSFLANYPNFAPIFQELKKQELSICRIFLIQVLEKSLELIGVFNAPELEKIKIEIESVENTPANGINEARKKMLQLSSSLHSKIKENLGENTIINTYLNVYQQHFQSYHLLDSFTATLHVIPEDIFSKNLINFPSKEQMLKMLQKQLKSLKEVNERLTKEIVDRKRIEEDLKHSEHLKTRILETALDGIILVNQDGVILDWNKQAEIILRVPKKETIGKSIYSLVPYQLRQKLQHSFKSYVHTETGDLINKRVETSVPLRDGSLVYVELTIIAIQTKDNYLFNAFFRDITHKKLIDNEIREAKEFAEKSAKAKSTFLSNMSHEIRTPLNVILGLANILQKSDFSNPGTDKKNLNGIQFSAENLLVLINDILDFSKIEAGKLTWQETNFNIHELINNTSRGFAIKAKEKGIEYRKIIDASVPKFIIGDQFRLNQILTNLIGNAIKFTQKGEVVVQINAEKTTIDQVTIHFAVRDTGIGIPADKLSNIFGSFYQVEKPGKDKIEGTGLGLSISKELIELQGGTLVADSVPDKGSNFKFSITYKTSTLQVSKPTSDPIIQSDISTSISEMNVLVVEDNKMNQFFIKQLLSNWNIRTDIADNGKIALEKLSTNTYDLVLMDMHMPVMDGPETAIKIRNLENPTLKNIPIVACSADVFPESKKTAIASGMDFYLTKPIREKALEELFVSLKLASNNNTESKEDQTQVSQNDPRDNDQSLCDFSLLYQIFSGDTEVIKSILEVFIEETPKDYQKLQKAIKDRDSVTAKKLAHKLKSSFKTIGISKQVHMLQQIEQAGEANQSFSTILKILDQLNNVYPKIISEIRNQIENIHTLEA